MFTRLEFLRTSLTAAAAAGVSHAGSFVPVHETALDRYIAKPTPEYRFDIVDVINDNGCRSYVISLISQQWRDANEVDKPLWKHWLTVTEPPNVKTSIGALVISGGSSTDDPPRKIDKVVADLATQTGAIVAEFHAVPNQPLTFADDGVARAEDDLIAYSWKKYLHSGDDTWLIRLPMTKAVVRAIDTVIALTAEAGGRPKVDRFVVGGASKRGWTAWLTPVVDKRVIAIVPVVIDTLNVARSADHAYRVYGFWPDALKPYEKMGIMDWLGTPQLNALLSIEDPYSYRKRITVPKLIVNASGDQFFTPDSSQFYFDGLPGEKYLRYLPNTDHSLTGASGTASQTGIAFVNSIITGTALPRYSWHFERDGTITVRTTSAPLSVKLWQAENPHARDFRLETIGRAFKSTDLEYRGGSTYAASISTPRHGFAAAFVEITYAAAGDERFTVTTDVRITPDVLPFGPPPFHRA